MGMGPSSCTHTRTRTHGKTRAKPAGIPVPVMFTTHNVSIEEYFNTWLVKSVNHTNSGISQSVN